MDWLFDSPWTFWLILALLFAIIEMLSLDLFFLMLSLSALITSAISPFIEHFFARGIVFAVLCILFVLILRPPLLKRLNRSAGNTVTNAKAFMKVQEEFGSFAEYIWSFTDNKRIINKWKELSEVPATSELSDKISKDLKKRGFKFVGSTIIYSFLQAIGIIDDHLISCPYKTE